MKTKITLAILAAMSLISAAEAAPYQYRLYAPGVVPSSEPPPGAAFAKMTATRPGVSVSADGLTVTHSAGGWNLSPANIGKASGKWYWEVRIDSRGSGGALGLIPYGDSSSAYFGPGTYDITSGSILPSGTPATGAANGDTVGVMMDLDTRTISFMVRCGAPVANPTPLPAGPLAPFTEGLNGTTYTLNFGASPFLCPVPAGFNKGYWQ